MKLLKLKISCASVPMSLLGLWLLAYTIGLGDKLLDSPLLFGYAFLPAISLGWLIMPFNFFHNLFGFPYEETPDWQPYLIFFCYWFFVLCLHLIFIRTRRWLVFLILVVVVLTSTHGCVDFVQEGIDKAGPWGDSWRQN